MHQNRKHSVHIPSHSHTLPHPFTQGRKMKASHIALCTMMVLLLAEVQVSMAVTCSPVQLSPCVSAITTSNPPSSLCCSKIREQKPCLCQYVRNPNLKKFVDSPNARRVASTCGTPFPRC
ncbi:non-specific lipid-transfer protein 2-like [Arachis stenosperma]|nr:non-specific lipid-transfer protein 2-like [Arachis stenosperma]